MSENTKVDELYITLQAEVPIKTVHGELLVKAYAENDSELMPHLCLVNPKTDFAKPVNVRVHSECMTGDVFGSNRCECGDQLHGSLSYIKEYTGMVIYLRQEGRGIGLINKLKAYQKQDEGLDTVEANLILGHQADGRSYDLAVQILQDLEVKSINLLTNNPDKIKGLEEGGIRILKRIPLEIAPNQDNQGYLRTKKDFFGHFLDL